MNMRIAFLAAPLLLVLTGAGEPQPAAYTADVFMAITTSEGTITIDLDEKAAPLTTANFLKYVDAKRLDGTAFYRAMHLDWGTQPNGLLQGGIAAHPRLSFPPVAHEPTDRSGILHKTGTISMARYAPGTAQADFSIMVSDQPGLDADPASDDPERRAGFAAFGRVVSGMDTVLKIWDSPRSQTKGEGVMKGQILEMPVRILSVRRVPPPRVPDAAIPMAAPLATPE